MLSAAASTSDADLRAFLAFLTQLRRSILNDKLEQAKSLLSSLPAADRSRILCLPEFDHLSSADADSRDSAAAAASSTLRSPLYFVRSAEMTELLLDNGGAAALEARDKYGRTPLHVACEKQLIDVARCLLQHAPSTLLHIRDDAGNSALHEATDPDLVRLLVKAGADIHCANALGDTPLYVAARSGRDVLVQTLLALGADPARLNAAGRTAMHSACERGHKSIVLQLLAASPPAASAGSSAVASPAVDLINLPDASGWTCLHLASLGGEPEHESYTPIVQLLLDRGARVDAADCTGLQPIHVCTDTSALRLLLAAGADLNARDADGRTPLHYLTTDSAVVLLETPGCLRDAQDRYGRTALHLASDPHKALLLVKKGADIDAKDKQGMTALGCALTSERPDVTSMLRELGAFDPTPKPSTPSRYLSPVLLSTLLLSTGVLLSVGWMMRNRRGAPSFR